jgi:hypothetical protein
MQDLRHIHHQHLLQQSRHKDDKELHAKIEDFHEQGKVFERKYSLLQNHHLQADFKDKKRGDYPAHWSKDTFRFKEFFLSFTNFKCPICSSKLQRDLHTDHYRNKDYYWWLAYEYDNYLPLCFDCNTIYKRSCFPVWGNKLTFDAFVDKASMNQSEQPLLFNPFFDDPLELYQLYFYDKAEKVGLILKDNLSDYQQEKAKTTIDLFNLDNHTNDPKSDRLVLLKHIYDGLIDCARARDVLATNKTQNSELQYFYKLKKAKSIWGNSWLFFIEKGQYKII